jgi:hypothetical protein
MNIHIYPALVLFGQIAMTEYFVVKQYKVTDQDISLLVLDSCCPTVRNGYSISPDFKRTPLGLLTLQDKDNMRTWSIYTYTCTGIDIYHKYFYFYDDLLFLLILLKIK